ncbi:MAG: HEAT repeat domain-containing protein [Deltaproteobacteria bacterium]|nr:HEAT repeat domain-containing protein [Deltaproteobacteria bacterium]
MRELIEQLNSPNRLSREEAERELQSRGREAVPSLIDALSHGERRVRFSAAKLLGLIKDRRAVGPLADLAQEPTVSPDERSLAIKAIAEMADPSLRYAPGMCDFFLRFRRDPDPTARAWAVHGIARLGDATLLPYVEEARRDREAWVRDMATAAVHAFRGGPATGAVAEAGAGRTIMVATLLPDADARAYLEAHPEAIVLDAPPVEERVATAVHRLNAHDSAARAHAIAELVAIGRPAHAALVQAALGANPVGRVEAVKALSALRERDTIPVLVAVLRDALATAELRALAARGLVGLTTEFDADARDALLEAGRTNDRYQKAAASAALAVFHDRDARAFLVDAAQDADAFVRDTALETLAASTEARDRILRAPVAELLLRETDARRRVLLTTILERIEAA